jgi:hypothetical protein
MGMRGMVTRPGSLVPGPPLTPPMPPLITAPAGLAETASNSDLAAAGETAAHVGPVVRVAENGGGANGGGAWARAPGTLISKSTGIVVDLRVTLRNREEFMVSGYHNPNLPR